MTERIFFEFAGEKFSLTSQSGVDLNKVILYLTPSFRIIRASNNVTCTINLYVKKFVHTWVDEHRPWRMPPILNVDLDGNGGGLRIVKYTDEEKIIYREPEKDSVGVLIEVNQNNRVWNITIAEDGILNDKTFSRTIKQLVGYCACKKKAQVLHASCAIIKDTSYVFFGPRGSGKSSFLFRCCTDLNADFKSDDLLICWSEGNSVQLSGWPRRMGISLSAFDRSAVGALKPFTLRRKQSLEDNWLNNIGQHYPPNSRKRILFDVDEFMHAFNTNYNDSTGKIVFVMLNFVNEKNTLQLTPLKGVEDHNMFTNPNQERHFVDYLNLAPSPLVPGVKHTFSELSSHNNLFQLSYGPDIFSDFSKGWQFIEQEIKRHATA
ncbi:hypothetical protein [Serratia quinivorans]|uniref:hypothetical protein n=1 Tax=Serratia quinivorans TaxID=137545 RepID=UPI00217921B2|nr:hypothetical protein [Serratia quinivorans]CAI0942112.1 Uncharacterised protein [Serratia quinivorans]CAI1741015.1 Uncharacterised protein [Serratia quinivorans]